MATYQRTNIHSSEDIIAIADHAGSYFFSPGTMKAFSSRVLQDVFPVEGNEAITGNRFFFVTSERHGDAPRHYAVRMLTLTSVRDDRPGVDIITVGEYHDTARAARKAAKEQAENLQYLDNIS